MTRLWRSIDDSPPKDGVTKVDLWTVFGTGDISERVLDCVWREGGWRYEAFDHNRDRHVWELVETYAGRITHWMLSPEPPK